MTLMQADLDRRMVDWGLERARKGLRDGAERGELGSTQAGIAAMRGVIEPLIQAVADRFVGDEAGGRPPLLFQRCGHMDPAVLAYLTLRQSLDKAGPGGATLTSTARSVGNAVEAEGVVRSLKTAEPVTVKVLNDTLAKRHAGRQKRVEVLRANARNRGHDPDPWPQRHLIMVGLSLIDLMLASCRLFEVYQVRSGRKTTDMIRLTKEAAKWLEDRTDKLGFLAPAYLPMVEVPTPWDKLRGGGYRGPLEGKLPLTKRTFRGQIDALKAADLGPVYASVNAIQETPWEVNREVLGVMKQAWDSGRPFPGVVNQEDLPLPPRSWTGEPTADELRAWKYQARVVYETNAKAQSGRFLMNRLLSVAEELKDAEALYFPHQLDFRGRVYSLPVGLSPQGPDESRSLLRFAYSPEGYAPVRDSGSEGSAYWWLCVHGANTFGIDKVSFQDRVSWVQANRERILATARTPFNDLWWVDADKPWSFLAFCFDLAEVYRGGPSKVPIAMDGSCNGLQHYAAMLRDPVAGEAVNLLPSPTPQDIYGRVAERTMILLRERADAGDWIARGWLDFGIDRKITKRPVMVLPYGGTRMSCIDYTRQAVLEKVQGGQENPFGDNLSTYSAQLAMVIWDAIGDVVVSARQAMEWLQAVAQTTTKAGYPLMWSTPSGFSGWQAYAETKRQRIDTIFGSLGRVQTSYYDELPSLDGDRQALAFPPNFVHSLDGSALALTIARAKREGIDHFACIHDSFGTLAVHANKLSRIIREEFVGMYEDHDPLTEVYITCLRLGLTVTPPPSQGTLDIRGVLDSPYFFA